VVKFCNWQRCVHRSGPPWLSSAARSRFCVNRPARGRVGAARGRHRSA
jgi:hypothetical protein